MALHMCKWDGDWHSRAWARADGLWMKPSPDEEAQDALAWDNAISDEGGLFRVMWCELCQLAHDIEPLHRPPAPAKAADSHVPETIQP